jgi:hypothetical protein
VARPVLDVSVWNPRKPHPLLLQIGGAKNRETVCTPLSRQLTSTAIADDGGARRPGRLGGEWPALPARKFAHLGTPPRAHPGCGFHESQTQRNREQHGRRVESERHGIMAEGACDF